MSLLTPMLRSSPLANRFNNAQQMQGILDFEAVLAQAQAICGMIPPEAIEPIVATCRHETISFAALDEATMGAGDLAISLMKQLTAQVKARNPEAARYVHWGATGQNAIDTGLMLQLRGALGAAETLLEQLVVALALQADRYRDTVMPGQTWVQHALPMTLDLKLTDTLGALLRWQQRLREMRSCLLVLQLGGVADTLGALKEKEPAVGQALAQSLGLSLPDTPWRSQRSQLLEAGAWFTGVCDTLGEFANDLSLLMQAEVAKIGESVAGGRGGSPTMPHKHNPVACATILTATQRTPGLMATLYASQFQQHERTLGGWQTEWETLPNLITLVGGALTQSEALMRDMQVFPQEVRAGLDITRGLIMTEAMTLALVEFIGKVEAHHHIETLCRQALDRHSPLAGLLTAGPQISQYLSRERLATLLGPATATGNAERPARQVLVRCQE